jgi:hypothetical protein
MLHDNELSIGFISRVPPGKHAIEAKEQKFESWEQRLAPGVSTSRVFPGRLHDVSSFSLAGAGYTERYGHRLRP